MKKLAGIFCAALLLACGISNIWARGSRESASSSSGPVVLTFWSLFTGGDGEFFDAMIEEFNRTHSDIQLRADDTQYSNYYARLTTALAARNAPDVVVIHRGSMLPYVQSGALYPLDEVMKNLNAPLDDFVPAAIDACRFDGTLYSLPLDVHPIIMYYNKDLLAAAGVTAVPQTIDELVAAAKVVQDATGAIGIGVDNTTATYKAYTLTRLFFSGIYQRGGTLLNADNTRAAFNNADGVKVIQDLIDMPNRYGLTPKGYDYDSAMTDFRLGKTAFYVNGVWATGALEQQQGLNFAAVPLPPFWGEVAAIADSHTLAIPIQRTMDQKKVEAAAEFILWMTAHGEMWARAGQVPTRFSVQEKPEFKALPYRADYAKAVESVVMPPNTPAWQEIYDNLSDLLEAAVAQNQTGAQAAAILESKVNEILAGYNN